MSGTQPTIGKGGEKENVDVLRHKYSFCADDKIIDIKCRVVGQTKINYFFGQIVTCDLANGLICNNHDQGVDGECLDYEISYFCNCES